MPAFDAQTLATIMNGARLLAVAQDMDPCAIERIVRKAAELAYETTMQKVRMSASNDRGPQ